MKNITTMLCLSMLFFFVSCNSERKQIPESTSATNTTAENDDTHKVLKTLDIDGKKVHLYVDEATDSAILGLLIKNENGRNKFFPAFASTFRGLPPGKLDFYVSEEQDQLWVKSSWANHETLIYHRLGTLKAITQFGNQAALDKPKPDMLIGGVGAIPEMDPAKAVLTETHNFE